MKLNAGCGREHRAGWLNADRRCLPGVELVFDLERPWPFAANSLQGAELRDVMEHLEDVVFAMDEACRVLQPEALLEIRGPHADGKDVWLDVTHRRAFVEHSFDHFDWSTPLGQQFRYGMASWQRLHVERTANAIRFVLTPRKELRA